MKNLRLVSSLGAVVLLALAGSTLASAQATRTWVSGVGDDANPCSRTAPCKTFAGAISKTAPGGEIDNMDQGGFGAVTITKSITIDGSVGGVGSILVSGTNGINIAAGPTDVVTLRNLEFQGIDNAGTSSGLDGIKITVAGVVHLENLKITGFSQYGVEVTTGAAINVSISNCTITDTGDAAVGVTTTAGTANAAIKNLRAFNTHPSIQGGANSAITIADSELSLSSKGIKQVAAGSVITIVDSVLTADSVDSIESFGGSSIFASGNTISQSALGVNPNGGTISSDGTNIGLNNTNNGSFNGTPANKY